MRGRKAEKTVEATGFQVKQHKDIQANNVMASGLAGEIRDFSAVDTDRACTNKESKKNKYSNSMPELAGKICTSQPICYGSR